jgi:predicted small secreted protein
MKVIAGLTATVLVCAMVGIGTAGCNTVRGAGKDIQRGGKAVEDAADSGQIDQMYPENYRFAIEASSEPDGSITPAGLTQAGYGANHTFVIRSNFGYHVADVMVDGESIGPVNQYTFHQVAEHHTITASFDENQSR